MPLVAILAGLVMLDLAFRGTEHEFAQQAESDFGGSSFLSWFGAVTILGAIGFFAPLRQLSNLAMALVIVVLVLRNGGLFAQLASVIDNPPAPAPAVTLSSYDTSSSSGGGLLGGLLGSVTGGGGDSSGGGLTDDIGDAGALLAFA
jgi:uncharacterized membrane protein YgcG